jgi:hypothetical protein
MRKLTYFLLIMFVSAGFHGFSQSVMATAKLDTNSMLIGDQVKLDISLSFPLKTEVSWPNIPDTILQTIQVVTRSKIDSTFSADKKSLTLHQNIIITSFDSGFYTIPPIRFFYRQLPDTAIRFVQTETLLLSVHTMAVDTTKVIKPIKGPLSVPMTFREILPWLIGAVLLILIIVAVIYYLRKRKKAEPIFRIRPEIHLPPDEIALAELEKLRIKKLWQTGKIKEYHSELTEILRKYIENRFNIMALEMTTQEILDSVRTRNDLQNESINKLHHILSMADFVKFAKMQPLPVENDLSMENAVGFVRETAVKKEQTVTHD